MLITTKFKTQGTYVYQAIQVTTEMERIVSAYIKHVRPHCFSKGGVLKSVSVAESAPLFVTPLTGGRIDKLSPYVISHTFATFGKRLHCTRFRSILHTHVDDLCTTKEREMYESSDGHSSIVAKQVRFTFTCL
jgi:hypothetical protein